MRTAALLRSRSLRDRSLIGHRARCPRGCRAPLISCAACAGPPRATKSASSATSMAARRTTHAALPYERGRVLQRPRRRRSTVGYPALGRAHGSRRSETSADVRSRCVRERSCSWHTARLAPRSSSPCCLRPRPRTPTPSTRWRRRARRHAAAGLQRDARSGAGSATRPRCASRPTAACSSPPRRDHQRLRQPQRHDADAVRRPAHARARLLGPRAARAGARPAASRPAARTCTCSTPTTRRRTRPSSRAGATAARRRPARPPTAA